MIQELLEKVHKAGKGNLETERVGSSSANRGIITAIVITEAMRNALKAYGQPLDGKKMRDGYRMIKLDAARLKELGASGMTPELVFSDKYHGGMDAPGLPEMGRQAVDEDLRLGKAL